MYTHISAYDNEHMDLYMYMYIDPIEKQSGMGLRSITVQ